jgi:hypothetical protein
MTVDIPNFVQEKTGRPAFLMDPVGHIRRLSLVPVPFSLTQLTSKVSSTVASGICERFSLLVSHEETSEW